MWQKHRISSKMSLVQLSDEYLLMRPMHITCRQRRKSHFLFPFHILVFWIPVIPSKYLLSRLPSMTISLSFLIGFNQY